MSQETLTSAAHRLVRYFRIDSKKGGLVVDETLAALEVLERQIRLTEEHRTRHPLSGEGDRILGEEGLLGAAKDVARNLRLDTTDHGGMICVRTEISVDTLNKKIRVAGGRKYDG